jgi:hypothetical protein
MSTLELRRRLRAYHEEFWRVAAERDRIEAEHWATVRDESIPIHVHLARPMFPELPDYPPFPEECLDMTCGAKTRAGTPCKRRDIFANGRCKLHGGASTGPRTKRGKRKSARNGRRPKKKRSP